MKNLGKYTKYIQTGLVVVIIFTSGFAFGNIINISQAQTPLAIGDTETAFEPLWETFSLIQNRYVDAGAVDVPSLVNGAIRGMVDSLGDQYSSYLSPSDYSALNSDISGNVEGIGVVIRTNEDTGFIEVLNVLPNAPAREAGVLPGDIFWEVDGRSVDGLNQSELASLVRGPAGSQVTIIFKRNEEFVEFTITRARFEIPLVEAEILDNDIAYIKLSEFASPARAQIERNIADLNVNARRGLIFDLRGNPGGLLGSAIDIASLFIQDGVILYETFSDGSEQTFEANGRFGNISVPIVVLVDESSASASELVAGAMQDRGVATVIGEITFGKGTVQTIQPLSNGGGLRLTIARYLLPSRRWVHEVGVTPDVIIEWQPESTIELETVDPQLDAAIDYLLNAQ